MKSHELIADYRMNWADKLLEMYGNSVAACVYEAQDAVGFNEPIAFGSHLDIYNWCRRIGLLEPGTMGQFTSLEAKLTPLGVREVNAAIKRRWPGEGA